MFGAQIEKTKEKASRAVTLPRKTCPLARKKNKTIVFMSFVSFLRETNNFSLSSTHISAA